jgi:hypothetical protein
VPPPPQVDRDVDEELLQELIIRLLRLIARLQFEKWKKIVGSDSMPRRATECRLSFVIYHVLERANDVGRMTNDQ